MNACFKDPPRVARLPFYVRSAGKIKFLETRSLNRHALPLKARRTDGFLGCPSVIECFPYDPGPSHPHPAGDQWLGAEYLSHHEGDARPRRRGGSGGAPRGSLIRLVESNGMRVIPFRHLVQPLHPASDALALWGLTRYLRSRPYHIVHTHNSKAGFLGRLAAKAAGVPVIVHTVHGFAFHDQEPFWRRTLFRSLERMASCWCDRMIFISQPLVDWALREGVTKERKPLQYTAASS